jgi:hypothetical protein
MFDFTPVHVAPFGSLSNIYLEDNWQSYSRGMNMKKRVVHWSSCSQTGKVSMGPLGEPEQIQYTGGSRNT